MKGKELLVLLLLFLLSGGIYFLIQHLETKKEEKSLQERSLFPKDPFSEVKSLEIYRLEEKPPRIFLRKEGDHWWIVEPIRYRAVDSSIDSFVQQIRDKTYERTLSVTDFVPFGLKPPKYTVTFATETSRFTLYVGNYTPFGGKLYVTKDPVTSSVYLIMGGFQYHLSKPLDEYRFRDLIWNFPNDVSYVRLVSEVAQYEITRTEGRWYLSRTELDTGKVDSLLSRIKNLTVRDFFSDSPTATPPNDPKPKRFVTLRGDTEITLSFFTPNTKDAYVPVRTTEIPGLFSIPEYSYREIWKSPEEYKKTPPAPLETTTVTTPVTSSILPSPSTPPISLLPSPPTVPGKER